MAAFWIARRVSACLSILFWISASSIPAQAQDPLTFLASLGTSLSIQELSTKIREDLKAIIDRAQSSVDQSSFSIYTQVSILLQNVDVMANALAGKVLGDLDDKQKAFFNNTLAVIDASKRGVRDVASQARLASSSMALALSVIPGADRRPHVIYSSPSFISEIEANRVVKLKIEGTFLSGGEPALKFEKGKCERVKKIDTNLEFNCDKGIFSDRNSIGEAVGKLIVYHDKTFWERVTSFFSAAKEYNYDIPIAFVPNLMGKYSGTAVSGKKVIERAGRSREFQHSNGHCEGPRDLNWNVTNTSGWSIDTNSITAIAVTGGSLNGVFDRSAGGFQVRATVRNHGKCFALAKDGRGSIHVRVNYAEDRETTQSVSAGVDQGQLTWDAQIVIPLPEGVLDFTVVMELADKSKIAVTRNGPMDFKWFRVEYLPRSNSIIVRPKPLHDAFEQ